MFRRLTLAAFATFALAATTASAQVPSGSFGVSAEFTAARSTMAKLLYTPSSNFQIDFGIGLNMTSFKVAEGETEPDAQTMLGFMLGGKYFINANPVSPYIALGVGYSMGPKTTTSTPVKTEVEPSAIMIMPAFGAQAMLTKNVALYGQIGLNVNMMTSKTTVTPTVGNATTAERGETHIDLGGSALGVSFYF